LDIRNKEKMNEFNREEALKEKAEIDYRLHASSINFTNSEEKNG